MSNVSNPPAKVQEITASAATWRERRDGDDWSEADQAELDAWLAESIGHQVEYWRIDAAWNRADRLSALRAPLRNASRNNLKPAALKGIAALIGAVLVGLAWTGEFNGPNEKVYSTPVGGHEILTLEDGSQIELNTNTVLRTAINADRRSVWLEKGEAYFEIRHDAAHPFVVTAGNLRVVDLGTKFVLRKANDRLEVSLIEGRARLEPTEAQSHQHAIMLTPGEVAVATVDSITKSRKSETQITNELGWRQGIIVLHGTALQEAVAEFNRYNETKLVIATPALAHVRVGGTFPVGDVEAFTRVAQQVFGLKVQKKGDEILISR